MNFTEYSCNSLQIRNICPVFDAKNWTFPNKCHNYYKICDIVRVNSEFTCNIFGVVLLLIYIKM